MNSPISKPLQKLREKEKEPDTSMFFENEEMDSTIEIKNIRKQGN